MSEKHTPLPWRTALTDETSIVGSDNSDVASMSGDYHGGDHENMAANAALICRAVNSHAELVAALEAARDAIAEWGAYAGPYFQEKWDLAGDIAKIDSVIARAKVQP
jgi:hypothetical protein